MCQAFAYLDVLGLFHLLYAGTGAFLYRNARAPEYMKQSKQTLLVHIVIGIVTTMIDHFHASGSP
jgi:hypothetical protein